MLVGLNRGITTVCSINGGYMLVITGVFENERFIPDKPVSIPQRKKVTVTIEEVLPAIADSAADRRAIFDKCRLDLKDFKFNRDEANDYD